MSSFDPQFAHDILIPLAEAAYVANRNGLNLPLNYAVVGPISVSQGVVANLAAQNALLGPHPDLIGRMCASGDGFGWVVENAQEETVVATFRGTADVKDWLHDFDFLPVPYEPVANYGMVHYGFQSVYLSIADSLKTLLQQAKSCKRLILTGHSLGAALTELAAPDILINHGFVARPEVQNFAGPRVGNPEFANVFDLHIDISFRIVNIWDIVPKVPPPLALFEHVGLAVNVDGGFTLDELVAHSLAMSYDPGLLKLIPQVNAKASSLMATVASNRNYANGLPIGREA
jgi:hypothetical protein